MNGARHGVIERSQHCDCRSCDCLSRGVTSRTRSHRTQTGAKTLKQSRSKHINDQSCLVFSAVFPSPIRDRSRSRIQFMSSAAAAGGATFFVASRKLSSLRVALHSLLSTSQFVVAFACTSPFTILESRPQPQLLPPHSDCLFLFCRMSTPARRFARGPTRPNWPPSRRALDPRHV